jgi:hypothetical protein
LVARVGIAGTLIYYYNTTDVFAEEPGRTFALRSGMAVGDGKG